MNLDVKFGEVLFSLSEFSFSQFTLNRKSPSCIHGEAMRVSKGRVVLGLFRCLLESHCKVCDLVSLDVVAEHPSNVTGSDTRPDSKPERFGHPFRTA